MHHVVDSLPFATAIVHAGDGSGRLFVVLKGGTIAAVDREESASLFLDIASIVKSVGSEQGLLGLAFHPDYRKNGHFFVTYTDLSDAIVVARYSVSSNPQIGDPGSASILLRIPKETQKHNAGQIAFGPDGYLYISTGDGDMPPLDPAQDPGSLLGKILRIDVDGAPPYGVPADNPFVGITGARGEIWATGLRNAWRFSFDRRTGGLFIADVGKNTREEINFQHRKSSGGENYGWRRMEGSVCLDPLTCNDGSLTLPIIEYDHSNGNCAVTGGYRYRGAEYPELKGIYFYGDFCSGRIWGASEIRRGVWFTGELFDAPFRISTFGEDEYGEVYVADYAGGVIYRIVTVVPDIKVNDSDGPITVSSTQPVEVSVALNPGSKRGTWVGWWIGGAQLMGESEVPFTIGVGIARMRQSAHKNVFQGTLSPGTYRFRFVLDSNLWDGWDAQWTDWVDVEVTPD